MNPETPRILVVRLSAVGDCLHAVPVVVELRRRFPRAVIGWALEEGPHELLKGHPMVDCFHLFPRRAFKRREGSWGERWAALGRFRRELREARYEVAIDLQGLAKSGLVAWWSRARRRIGFRGPESRECNWLFAGERVRPPDECRHVVERNLALLAPLGIPQPSAPAWVMPAYVEEEAPAEAFLAPRGLGRGSGRRPFAVLNPGASWRTKRWPPERFGEVAQGLATRHELPAVVTWAGAEELAAAETIARTAGHPEVHVAPPTSLRQLAALLARADLFVGNDTGPLHLAVALGVRSVAIFGASDSARNGPYGGAHRVQAGKPPCQPCWKTTCARGDLACLAWVPASAVLESCARVLEAERSSTSC